MSQQLKRTGFAKLVKWGFIAFNVLMVLWMASGLSSAGDTISSASSDAEVAGTAIGTGIGMMLIAGIWFFGFVIGGIMMLLTRPK